MTDHSVTDLSYGHLGKASYDTEETQWTFSKSVDHGAIVHQITPLTECFKPEIQNAPVETEVPSVVARRQLNAILKARPEIYTGGNIASTFAKASLARESDQSSCSGALFDVGHAFDVGRVSHTRKPRIFALASGSAGHILHLARPKREVRNWGKRSAARLSMLDPSFVLDHGYWIGTGGPICQILFSRDGEESPDTWLAVRQAAVITIFLPLYGKLRGASSSGYSPGVFPPSLLDPNPIVSIDCKPNDTSSHADLSFNPWYSQQFALVDSHGSWEIYDLEKPHGKAPKFKIGSSRRGKFYEADFGTFASPKPLNGPFDGWFRILWVCDFNTIAVCDRRLIVVFDIKGEPVSIGQLELFAKSSSDWILDMKLCVSDNSQLLVLTTSRIVWVQVAPAGEIIQHENSYAGFRVLLSFRHFSDPSDETMKLTIVKNGEISVLVTSSKSPVVNMYNFSIESGTACCQQYSLTLNSDGMELSIDTACLVTCTLFAAGRNHGFGPEAQYLEQGVRFRQLWILSSGLGLSSTLCAIKRQDPEANEKRIVKIEPPTKEVLKAPRRLEERALGEPFIVADGLDHGDPLTYRPRHAPGNASKVRLEGSRKDDLRLRLDWRSIFQNIYQRVGFQRLEQNPLIPLTEILTRINRHIQRGAEDNHLPLSTIFEISGLRQTSDDLDSVSPILRDFMSSMYHNQDPEAPSSLVAAEFITCSSLGIPVDGITPHLDLLTIYNLLVENWMATLSPNVSNRSRGSKFTIIRQLALDLCFNSLGFYIQNKLVSPSTELGDPKVGGTAEKDNASATTRESSADFFSSQLAAINEQETDFRLPTPVKTPSLFSQATSGSELAENHAIARLRQYVPSITAKADLEKPALLYHWPSVPGSEPVSYSYEAAQKASATAKSGDEGNYPKRREEARRRGRTEKFLRQERSRAVEAASQAAVTPSGSQPEVLHQTFSSQVVEEVPMTQPDRGLFGSRSVQAKKRVKKRAAGFR